MSLLALFQLRAGLWLVRRAVERLERLERA